MTKQEIRRYRRHLTSLFKKGYHKKPIKQRCLHCSHHEENHESRTSSGIDIIIPHFCKDTRVSINPGYEKCHNHCDGYEWIYEGL